MAIFPVTTEGLSLSFSLPALLLLLLLPEDLEEDSDDVNNAFRPSCFFFSCAIRLRRSRSRGESRARSALEMARCLGGMIIDVQGLRSHRVSKMTRFTRIRRKGDAR